MLAPRSVTPTVREGLRRTAFWILVAVVVGGPLLFGGVLPWTGVAIALGSALAAALAALAAVTGLPGRAPRFALLALSVGWVWTCVQALVLPCEAVETLSPDAAARAKAAFELLDQPPVCTITWDRGETLAQVVQGAGVLSAFLAAALLGTVGRGRQVLAAVGVASLAMALVALGHLAADAGAVWGVYRPLHAHPRLLAPIMNENHLAGFLLLGAAVWLGWSLDQSEPRKRWAALGAVAVLSLAVALTFSRGGVAALVLGLALTIVVGAPRARRRGSASVGIGGPMSRFLGRAFGAVAVAAAVATYVGMGRLRDLLDEDVDSKAALLAAGLSLASDAPVVGFGRGAFSVAFVERFGTDERFTHAENWALQWTAEWGLPVALLIAVGLAVSLAKASTRARTGVVAGTCAGLVAVVCQNLVDYGLERPALATLSAVGLGVVTVHGRSSRRRTGALRAGTPANTPFAARLLAFVCLASICGLAFRVEAIRAYAEQRQLERYLREGDHSRFRDTLVDAVSHHPSEPAFPLLAANESARRGADDTLHWLNRAMSLAPGWGEPHAEAARWFLDRGATEQAALHVREAIAREPARLAYLPCLALKRSSAAALIDSLPGPDGIDVLRAAARCLPTTHADVAALDDVLMVRDPGDDAPVIRHAGRLVAARRGPEAVAILESRLPSPDPALHVGLVRALLASSRPTEALDAADRGAAATGDVGAFLELRAEAHAAAGSTESMREAWRALRDATPARASALGRVYRLKGRLERDLGNLGAALHDYEEAWRLDGKSASLERVAQVAGELGDTRRAYRAYSRLCNLDPDREAWCEARDEALAP